MSNFILICIIIISTLILYQKYLEKQSKQNNSDKYYDNIIQNFLNNQNNKKPILWIHIPQEYNSRCWESWGTRSSFNLNQPYLYLCSQSIIKNCEDSFNICFIDDFSFEKLIPNWNFSIKNISDPILFYIRHLGFSKLIYNYGGMIMPISFLCFKDLIGLYNQYTKMDNIFILENANIGFNPINNNLYSQINWNTGSSCQSNMQQNIQPNVYDEKDNMLYNFYWYGCDKFNKKIKEYIHFIEIILSTDYTNESIFKNKLDLWWNMQIEKNPNEVLLVPSSLIGLKNNENKKIHLEQLFETENIIFNNNFYGILIPYEELLKRNKYEWFLRMDRKQLLNGNFILAKYFVLSSNMENNKNIDRRMIENFSKFNRLNFNITPQNQKYNNASMINVNSSYDKDTQNTYQNIIYEQPNEQPDYIYTNFGSMINKDEIYNNTQDKIFSYNSVLDSLNPDWVSFWKVPISTTLPVYGLMPMRIGNNVPKFYNKI